MSLRGRFPLEEKARSRTCAPNRQRAAAWPCSLATSCWLPRSQPPSSLFQTRPETCARRVGLAAGRKNSQEAARGLRPREQDPPRWLRPEVSQKTTFLGAQTSFWPVPHQSATRTEKAAGLGILRMRKQYSKHNIRQNCFSACAYIYHTTKLFS